MHPATRLAVAVDPVRLALAAGITPDPWQGELLRSAARQILMASCRQSGKSTVAALLALNEALHRAPALVLILAPALRQAQELFRKVKAMLVVLADLAPPIARETELTLEFVTGSRIVCLPGKDATVRGFSAVSLLVVDEASRASSSLYFALRPMLAVSGGRIVLLSTFFGKLGFFYEEYEHGGPDWHRVKVTAYECPRISREWLEHERQQIPESVFAQEYLCIPSEVDDAVFRYETVMAALSHNLRPFLASEAA